MLAHAALGVIVALGLLIAVPLGFQALRLYILSQWAVMTIAAIGLNLTLGYAGQVSLAQGAFVGIGAYTAAILTTHGAPLCRRARRRGRAVLRRRLAARLSRAARAAPLSRLRHAGLHHAGLPGVAQRGVADRRHLRHRRHSAAGHFRALRPNRPLPYLLFLPRFAAGARRRGAVVADPLALGPRLRRAARKSDRARCRSASTRDATR